MQYIPLQDVLRQMEALDSQGNPIPFTITVQRYNKRTKEGGDLVTIKNAVISRPNRIYTRELRAARQQIMQLKSPNHFKNSTRNIREVGTMDLIKIHIYLIYVFNGQQVVLNMY